MYQVPGSFLVSLVGEGKARSEEREQEQCQVGLFFLLSLVLRYVYVFTLRSAQRRSIRRAYSLC